MQNFSRWDEEEVKTLFKFVEIKKSEGMPLIQIFSAYARATKRHTNSVRNYYYKELSLMQKQELRAEQLNINLSNHEVVRGVPFSKEEEQKMMSDIQELLNKGYSVRKACLKLSGGDASKMIRLQNKYRSIIKQQKQDQTEKSTMGEIIKMPQTKTGLNEDDIKALFMGLIKLVKKQEYENAKIAVRGELYDANQKLKTAIAEIAVRENTISQLKAQIAIVKTELREQKQEVIKNRVRALNKNKTAVRVVKEYFNQKNSNKVDIEKAEN